MFLPGTAPRCLRMDPGLLGRTVRFHPCLKEDKRDTRLMLEAFRLEKVRTTVLQNTSNIPCGEKTRGLLTLKMALTFLWGIHCHVYWCPPSHNAPLHGCLSAPQSSRTLAARNKNTFRVEERMRQGVGCA